LPHETSGGVMAEVIVRELDDEVVEALERSAAARGV
jgi:plasmid stability protein